MPATKAGRGWYAGGPLGALRGYKGDLAGLALPLASILKSCVGLGCLQWVCWSPFLPSYHSTLPHQPDNIHDCGIQGRSFLVVELVATLTAWKLFLWVWGCFRKQFSPIWALRQVPSSEEQVSFVLPLIQGDSWALGIRQGGS